MTVEERGGAPVPVCAGEGGVGPRPASLFLVGRQASYSKYLTNLDFHNKIYLKPQKSQFYYVKLIGDFYER